MNRILIAATAVLALAGVASAQEAPALIGDYSANVLNDFNETALQGNVDTGFTSSASARNVTVDVEAPQTNSRLNDFNYSR
jgi:hypothetical protein